MSRFCVIAGTKISLNDGTTLPIEKVKAGQEIISFNLNTLQKSQNNEILLKLSTDTFDGVIQKDLVKNIWKNTVEEYYSINDKLKITGEHIVLAKRDDTFYWTTVDKLLIGDYLFTEQNIFEKIDMIILIKEKVKVYNLQVNDVYNYFANSYLIHNGAPCGASCAACGAQGIVFPVTSNPSIQWIIGGMEAEKSNVSTISGTSEETIDPELYWSGISILGTNLWITGGITVSRNSYSNADSDTVYYLEIPVATDFTPKVNTSGNMASTGFTWWYVTLGPVETDTWWGPFTYRGIATGDTTTISSGDTLMSATGMYHGPLIFMNSANSGGHVQVRKPSSTTGGAKHAYISGAWHEVTSSGSSENHVWIFIWKISSTGDTKYTSCVRDKSNGFYKPSALTDQENSSTFSSSATGFQGSTQFGLKSSTNVGKPWFNNSTYTLNTAPNEKIQLISSGWANREYSDSETNDLRDKLKDLYFGVGRGDA